MSPELNLFGYAILVDEIRARRVRHRRPRRGPDKTHRLVGVRNYQARNFMLKQMQIGDQVFFYHSSCPSPGIAGIAQVASARIQMQASFDRKSPYFDSEAKRESPRWFNVDVRFVPQHPAGQPRRAAPPP